MPVKSPFKPSRKGTAIKRTRKRLTHRPSFLLFRALAEDSILSGSQESERSEDPIFGTIRRHAGGAGPTDLSVMAEGESDDNFPPHFLDRSLAMRRAKENQHERERRAALTSICEVPSTITRDGRAHTRIAEQDDIAVTLCHEITAPVDESELISPPPSPPSSPGLPFDPIALLAPKVGKNPLEQKRRIVQGRDDLLSENIPTQVVEEGFLDQWGLLEGLANESFKLEMSDPTPLERLQYHRCLARPYLLPNVHLPVTKAPKDEPGKLFHAVYVDKNGDATGELVSLKSRQNVLLNRGILTSPTPWPKKLFGKPSEYDKVLSIMSDLIREKHEAAAEFEKEIRNEEFGVFCDFTTGWLNFIGLREVVSHEI